MFTIDTRFREIEIDPSILVVEIGDVTLTETVTHVVDYCNGGWELETENGGFVFVLYGDIDQYLTITREAIVYVYLDDEYRADGHDITHYGPLLTGDGAPCCRAMVTAPGEHEYGCDWQ